MRKLILSMQVSLDGFVEGPDGDSSWINKDDEESWADLFEMLQSVDLFILGSGMWPEYRDYWKKVLNGAGSPANHVKYAKLAARTKHIVFSKTLQDAGWENAAVVHEPVTSEITKLKQSNGKDIQVVGGAKLAAAIIEAGLVDEYRLTINPVIVGSGKSFFRDQHTKQVLDLINTRQLSSGAIIASYRLK